MKVSLRRASNLPIKYDIAEYDLFLKANGPYKAKEFRTDEIRIKDAYLSKPEDLISLCKEFGEIILDVSDEGELVGLIYDDHIE